MHSLIGSKVQDGEGRTWIEVTRDTSGVALYGPYIPLLAGMYAVISDFELIEPAPSPAEIVAVFDVVSGLNAGPIVSVDLLGTSFVSGPRQSIKLPFELNGTTFGLQFRLITTGRAALRVCTQITLEQDVG